MPKVLIIEDDPQQLHLYVTAFSHREFVVEEAANGPEGLAKAANEKPDVILLDLLLPGMSGFEILERLKAKPETKDIPIVVMSNLTKKDVDQDALNKGAKIFLSKAEYVP
ncbi:MAG: response regulator, partial [Patescibacteria group bacterium]